jgi:hypothetical protein
MDATEVEALYAALEHEVVPEFYERDENDMPSRWLARIRESMARLAPEFSASRAIREYTGSHYLPAASGCCERAPRTVRLDPVCSSGNAIALGGGKMCALAPWGSRRTTAGISSKSKSSG